MEKGQYLGCGWVLVHLYGVELIPLTRFDVVGIMDRHMVIWQLCNGIPDMRLIGTSFNG